jgi:hypothetical protein
MVDYNKHVNSEIHQSITVRLRRINSSTDTPHSQKNEASWRPDEKFLLNAKRQLSGSVLEESVTKMLAGFDT